MDTPFIFTLFEGLDRQGPGSDACTNRMFDILSPPDEALILDIGCGGGMFAGELKKRQAAEVWGVEINEDVAQQARQNVDHLIIGDITKLVTQLPDRHFDVIV
nr:class I SAM-dependent methyltransferase [Methanoregulaceae archaeon]